MVSGKIITLDGTGGIVVSPSQTTDGSGKVTFTGTAPPNVATGWTYQGHFAGDSLYKKSDSPIRTYNTIKHAVTLGLAVLKSGDPSGTTSTSVAPGENYRAQGTLRDPLTGKLLEGKTITFTASDPITISDKTTNLNGFYSGSQAAPRTLGTYNIQSHFAGDDLYSNRDSTIRTLTVSLPSTATSTADTSSSPSLASTSDAERSTTEEPASNEEDAVSEEEEEEGEEDDTEQDGRQNDRAQND